MRIATWNLKQAVAPRKKVTELMGWADSNIGADVYAFTEAKVPEDLDPRWQYQWEPEGVYPDKPNKWGTVLASNRLTLNPVVSVGSKFRSKDLQFKWPAAVQVADVIKDGKVWCTLVGLYAVTRGRTNDDDRGNGSYSLPKLLSQLEPLFNSPRGDRVIVAGDFNLWPGNVKGLADKHDLIDLVEMTADTREPLVNCHDCKYFAGTRKAVERCGHLFTHRNGAMPKDEAAAKRSRAMVQQIDFIWASKKLSKEVVRVYGGLQSFPKPSDIPYIPEIWKLSDHAPVIAEFRD